MIDTLILDWSGTLADDLPVVVDATNATLASFGGEAVTLEIYRRDFRIPVMEFYEPRIPGRSLEEIDEAFFGRYRARLAEVPLYEGVRELLHTAKARGLRLLVLSTVPRPILETLLEIHDLGGLFEHVEGGATDKREVLPRLLAEHGIERDRALYIGDTAHDVETAHVARVRAGASLYGYGRREAMLATRPDHAFENAGEVLELLDRERLMETVPLVIPTVGGLLRDPEGRILLVRTKKWSDTFGIPGGKIDYGETMLDAYEREIHEEVGLKVRDSRFVMIQDCVEPEEFVKTRHFLLINYISEVDRPEDLRINYEIEEALWVRPEDAYEMKLNIPTRTLLDELAREGMLEIGGAAS